MNKLNVLFLQFLHVSGLIYAPQRLHKKFQSVTTDPEMDPLVKKDLKEIMFIFVGVNPFYLKDIQFLKESDEAHFSLKIVGREAVQIPKDEADILLGFEEEGLWESKILCSISKPEWKMDVLNSPEYKELNKKHGDDIRVHNIAALERRYGDVARIRDRTGDAAGKMRKLFESAFEEVKA
jgi:hypothetical protein